MRPLLYLLFILPIISSCQDFGALKIIASLPFTMDEISGIETVSNSPLLWMVNDHGNSSYLYGYNVQTKTMERTISLVDLKNKDWEDLASDEEGNLYIGDFGNNANKRKKLAIHKVIGLTDSLTYTTKTTFYYEDQMEFPPNPSNFNYDVESFLVYKDHFYLFTRNRSKDFDGTTKLYRIPAMEGHFAAKYIGSYKTCSDKKDCQITSATIHHPSGIIALLSYNKVWILSNYQGDSFFEGTIKKIKLKHRSQKESIAFKNEKTLYIADERTGATGGNLYELPLKK